MSQAPEYVPAGFVPPPRPASRRKLLLVPGIVALLIIGVPGTAFAFSQNQLRQAETSQAGGLYRLALDQYATVQTVAGNPVARVLLGDVADKARAGTAETHFVWGVQLQGQGRFAEAETQLHAVVQSGIADWASRGNQALADLFLAWGKALVQSKSFPLAIEKYRQVSAFDPAGNLTATASAQLATAYSGYADAFALAQPPDYPNALMWYRNLLKDFPDSVEAKQAQAATLPKTLFNAGTAYAKQGRFQDARDAMSQVVQSYGSTPWAAQASAALAAKQPLTGKLVVSDQNSAPVPNRLVRIATKWSIVAPHTYQDWGGAIFQVTTDAQGNFSVSLPPGTNYLITWWDPSRSTFVTTFLSDNVPVNQVTVNPLEPAHTTVATS